MCKYILHKSRLTDYYEPEIGSTIVRNKELCKMLIDIWYISTYQLFKYTRGKMSYSQHDNAKQ